MESIEAQCISFLTPSDENSKRYLRLPYKMMADCFDNMPYELSFIDAFILMVANVRYNDTSEAHGDEIHICRRGESYKSLQAWSDLFHWNKSKTRRFFIKLTNSGIIEYGSNSYTTQIRIIHYDYYVGSNLSSQGDCYSADFESFWKSYHNTTKIAATDKLAAYKLWCKLPVGEREKALSKINRYYFNLAKTTYCAKALTYLKNKKFNDQFLYNKF